MGTSGLSAADYNELDIEARKRRRAVVACGNFALTAVLLRRFAEAAAKHIPQWEITDYASDANVDGAMLAIRRVSELTGVHHGLDAVVDV